MKILLAVDGSEYTRRMLDYIATHKDLFDPSHEYVALTVVAPVPPRVRGYIDRDTVEGYYREQAEEVLAPLRERAAALGKTVRLEHRVGHAPDVVAATASEGQYDLLVMGSHGHSPIGALMLGSTTARVLAHCTTPLLIVR